MPHLDDQIQLPTLGFMLVHATARTPLSTDDSKPAASKAADKDDELTAQKIGSEVVD